MGSGDASIFAFSRAMAELLAHMRSAFQELPARLTTAGFLKPARLVLQNLFAADATLFNQEWAFWTVNVVGVTLMVNLGVAADSSPGAGVPTLRRLCAALMRLS